MIICNGSPKTGTHLLLKAIHMFGGRCILAVHRHIESVDSIEHQHIHIIRCPRNAFISYIRMSKIEPTQANIIREMPRFIKEYSQYLHYLDDKNTLNIRFESLLSDPNELNRIAILLDKPLVENHFDRIIGGTSTYNETPSCYKEMFNDKIMYAWGFFCGDVLESALGYSYD